MSKVFFISDTHFWHNNILLYEPIRAHEVTKRLINKGYIGTEEEIFDFVMEAVKTRNVRLEDVMVEHDSMLIEAWNKVVHEDDIVWHLGDFCLQNPFIAEKIVQKLNGHIRLIRGNHDNWSDDFYRAIGFEYVSKYPIVVKNRFILSHKPLNIAQDNPSFFNIYGHVHSNAAFITKTANSQCVCCERSLFAPVEIQEFNKE